MDKGYKMLKKFHHSYPLTVAWRKKAHYKVIKKHLNSDEKITLVALGPLTNIALLLRSYPEVINKIEMITIMGGSVYSGNILPKAEFNIIDKYI